jgi:hypothetical protein
MPIAKMKFLLTLLLAVALYGCAATGPQFSIPEPLPSNAATLVIYRWGVLNPAGTGVPAKLEINDMAPRKLPYEGYITITLPPGEITLSATDMLNLHYSDKYRMTLRESVNAGEIAYFRLTYMFGRICTDMYDVDDLKENVRLGTAASATYYPHPDLAQTSCFQRVPEVIALKNLRNLRKAD